MSQADLVYLTLLAFLVMHFGKPPGTMIDMLFSFLLFWTFAILGLYFIY